MKRKMKLIALDLLIVALSAWLTMSYLDITANNMPDQNHDYAPWNAITLVYSLFD